MADLADSDRAAVMDRALARKGIAVTYDRIRPARRGPEPPLSFAQQRLWFLDQMEPGTHVYNIPFALRLRGTLDVAALASTIDEIVRRHETLRTAFPAKAGVPYQRIGAPTPRGLAVVDVSELDEPARGRAGEAIAAAEGSRPFDLATGPLVRIVLVRRAAHEHVLIGAMHHAISDGWSAAVLVRELTAIYPAVCAGQPCPLPPLEIQYADYAIWQRERLRGAALQELLQYWRQQLAGLPALALPTDRPRPTLPTHQGDAVPFVIPASTTAQLAAFCRSEGITLFMLLLAVFDLLLHRCTGQDDIAVGTEVSNRSRRETESLIGFFVNQLVLRTSLRGNPTCRELLARVRQVAREAYAHQDLPFERLVDELAPQRDLGRSPLSQVNLVLQNAPAVELSLPGVTVGTISAPHDAAKFDLTLFVQEAGSTLAGSLDYAVDLFDRSTAERLLAHWLLLLDRVVADPDQRVADMAMLTPGDERLLAAWAAGPREAVRAETVETAFTCQAELTPDATALVCGAIHVSYADLNRRANQLARYLQELGVGAEARVAVALERSADFIIAVLGILKAGGAYVPIDPGYPAERIAWMLDHCGAVALVARDRLLPQLSSFRGARVSVDADAPRLGRMSPSNVDAAADLDSAAYVIFTSGSTGRPKGVCIARRGLRNLAAAQAGVFGVRAGSRVLLFSSPSFDASVSEWSITLTTGGCLVVLEHDATASGAELAALLHAQAIEVATIPPSVLATVPVTELPALRSLIVAGEACPATLRKRWRRGRRMFDAYGPTEITVCASIGDVSAIDAPPTIGKPLANSTVYVLDRNGHMAPIGAPGEICVGGAGVGRGYVDQPALTAERFAPDPFASSPGARMYRTGDVGRWTSAGELAFVGRQDEQVKIRGHRVEPGEVEAALRQEPEVRDAVVVGRPTPGGEGQRLVAYVVAAGAGATLSGLRRRLTERLPGYLVPSVVVPIAQVPLTPNGKVDRQALPAPEETAAEVETAYVAPRTEAEARLGEIWGRLLGVARVGVHDNFFELGGDSILSVQVVAWARRAGLVLTTRQVFQHQTVAALAAVARSEGGSAARQDTVTGPVAVTPVQQWFFEQAGAAPHHFNQSVLLTAKAALDGACLATAVTQLLAHHDALRMRFWRDGAGWHQENAAAEPARVVATVDLREVGEAAVAAVAAQVQASLDLARGPLVRVVALRRPGEVWQVLLVIHHLVVDGVSWRILLEDLQRLYGAARRGEAAALGAKTTAFQQWAAALRQYAGTGVVRAERAFWSRQRQAGRVPRDHETGANTVGSTATVVSELAAAATTALLQQVPKQAGAPVQAVLLTALADAVAPWSGTAGVGVELEGHGREDIAEGLDVSRTVGWFTTLYPVWLPWAAEAAPLARVQAVQAQLRAIPRGGIGYGVLRYLSADAGRPVVEGRGLEVSFNYLGQFDQLFTGETLWEPALAASGPEQPPARRRPHVLAVTSHIVGGRLRTVWTYSTHLHRPATIAQLAARFAATIDEILLHVRSAADDRSGPHRLDAPGIDRDELDEMLRDVSAH